MKLTKVARTFVGRLLIAIGMVASLVIGAAARQQTLPQDLPPPLAPGEVQRLLDGYAVIQAQEFLGLSDEQFGQFLPRLRALQEVRRRNEQERVRLLVELNRMTNPKAGQVADADIRDRLRSLRELEARSATDLQRAYDAIDQTIDLRQQARFRIFEQQIEQRKLQLLMRARQANRQNRPPA
jgi:hypothetical protein